MKFLKKIVSLLKETWKESQEDNISRLAAALAYYTIFSLAPLLIIAIAVAGFIWSRSAVETQVLGEMGNLLGAGGADFIRTLLDNASENLEGGLIATMIGVVVLIFGSLGVFRELRNALNTIWEVEPEKVEGFWNSLKNTLVKNVLSFAMVMGVAFVLLVSLVVSTAITAVNSYLNALLPLPDWIVMILNNAAALVVVAFIFAVLFKYLPEAPVAWKDVLLGGFVTSFLFILGKFGIGLYLGNSSIGASFGAAGSLALMLVWVYYSAQILFFGAEFTQVYACTYGSKSTSSQGPRKVRPAHSTQRASSTPHKKPIRR